jgi:hypothetical protein
MNKQELVRESQQALARNRQLPADERLQRLIDEGIIDEQGNVRDKLQFWHAYLAVVAIKPGGNGKRIESFRCLKPAFGLPGAATIDVCRDHLAQYLAEGKRVITAFRDDAQERWKEGQEVHLTRQGYLRTDPDDDEKDNLGSLPEFETVQTSR